MICKSDSAEKGWLAFELNVLRRLKFASAILPFTGEPNLGAYLKRWNARVSTNDAAQSAWIKAVALIENNTEKLTNDDVNLVLEDAYVPRYRLQNESLKKWFGETDAWWFDNVRQNVEKLDSPVARAIALTVGMNTGDYALAFSDETLELRQPLSSVFKRLLTLQPEPFNNNQKNSCQNKTANEFIAENYSADLMFLRLPTARRQNRQAFASATAWREEWIRGADDFWSDSQRAQAGRLGAFTETKSQYLNFVEDTLRTASHVPVWAVAHVEDGFVSTQEIAEIIGRIRRIDTIFTKDFSELTGTKAVIITA